MYRDSRLDRSGSMRLGLARTSSTRSNAKSFGTTGGISALQGLAGSRQGSVHAAADADRFAIAYERDHGGKDGIAPPGATNTPGINLQGKDGAAGHWQTSTEARSPPLASTKGHDSSLGRSQAQIAKILARSTHRGVAASQHDAPLSGVQSAGIYQLRNGTDRQTDATTRNRTDSISQSSDTSSSQHHQQYQHPYHQQPMPYAKVAATPEQRPALRYQHTFHSVAKSSVSNQKHSGDE
jgi:hypothetical protein